MSLYATDVYFAERSYPLDEVQSDILMYLYMPLIGKDAYGLYMFLYNEGKRMDRVHHASPISRISIYLNYDLELIEESVKVLTAVGLLKTYVRQQKDRTVHLYLICSPLSLKDFFRNQILITLLQNTIGRDEFEKSRTYFRINGENLKLYEEEDIKFTDVFSIDLNSPRPLRMRAHYLDRQNGDIPFDYDMTLFEQSLRDHQIPLRHLSRYIDAIIQLGYVYQIDPLTLASLVRDSYYKDQFDFTVFQGKVKNQHKLEEGRDLQEVYLKQTEGDKSIHNASTPLEKHLFYLENVSPYELLKNRQGGKEPIPRDLAIVETLMVQLGLTPAVTNVLIEYVLGKNDNRLPKSYIETIGASWARKHLKTAKDAYECAKGTEVEPDEPVAEESKTVDDHSSNEALMDILKKMKGGAV